MGLPYYAKPGLWYQLFWGRQIRPWLAVENISSLNPGFLRDNGVEGLIFDVDNTLTDHHGPQIRPELKPAFDELSSRFPTVIFSNCRGERFQELLKIFDIPVVANAHKKPEPGGFLQAAGMLKLPPGKIAMVGDRLSTDILGGNRAGMRTIWVQAFDDSEPNIIRRVRRIETARARRAGWIPANW